MKNFMIAALVGLALGFIFAQIPTATFKAVIAMGVVTMFLSFFGLAMMGKVKKKGWPDTLAGAFVTPFFGLLLGLAPLCVVGILQLVDVLPALNHLILAPCYGIGITWAMKILGE